MQIEQQTDVPGLYRVVRGAVNTYLLNDVESHVTIIDTGYPGTARRILHLLHDIGRIPQDVRHILITHADLDHIGSLNALVKATGAQVYASVESQHYVQAHRSPPHLHFPIKLIAASVEFFSPKVVDIDHIVVDSDVLDIAGGMHVIATPGHTPDHLSYFWPRQRVLFAGDLIRNLSDGLSISPKYWTHDMTAARRSAQKVLALNPAVICPGHGEVWLASESPEQLEALRHSLD